MVTSILRWRDRMQRVSCLSIVCGVIWPDDRAGAMFYRFSAPKASTPGEIRLVFAMPHCYGRFLYTVG